MAPQNATKELHNVMMVAHSTIEPPLLDHDPIKKLYNTWISIIWDLTKLESIMP